MYAVHNFQFVCLRLYTDKTVYPIDSLTGINASMYYRDTIIPYQYLTLLLKDYDHTLYSYTIYSVID